MRDVAGFDHQGLDAIPSILAVEQLAILIHKSPASIRSDASRNPSSLPPICRLPGNKRLLWRLQDVQAWLESFVERAPQPASLQIKILDVPKRRGRPRKTEQRSVA